MDDPVLSNGVNRVRPAKPFMLELSALRDTRVWRFAFYYFFVFGAFVALALWLPRYLIGVYGFDIATAGMIGALYSIPASIFRAYGGVLSDRIGARYRDVLEPRRLGGRDARPLAAADQLRRARHQRRYFLALRDRCRRPSSLPPSCSASS